MGIRSALFELCRPFASRVAAGRPLGRKVIALLPGTYALDEAVRCRSDIVIVGATAVERRQRERDVRIAPIFPWLVNVLERDARGRASRTPARQRHRLAALIEAAKHSAEALAAGHATADVLSIIELSTVLDLFEAWREDPAWERIAKSLRDPGEFVHGSLVLAVATYLLAQGNDAAIPLGGTAYKREADLYVTTTPGTTVGVEVKVPSELETRTAVVGPELAESIVTQAFRKAGTGSRGQLSPQRPGFLVLGGFHLASSEISHVYRQLSPDDREFRVPSQ